MVKNLAMDLPNVETIYIYIYRNQDLSPPAFVKSPGWCVSFLVRTLEMASGERRAYVRLGEFADPEINNLPFGQRGADLGLGICHLGRDALSRVPGRISQRISTRANGAKTFQSQYM